ncbi:MAG: aminotransferase class III-fold pyridoxal phosphate-dependent enzyme, partial [Leptolinea sp.]|nr:aminotransferase class III-fold pyridoxal phosphate-dependent enzyme [Leptolinea sp.]
VENSRKQGEYLKNGLFKLMEAHPIIGDVRGLGLMVGFEFVSDQKSREPFPPKQKVSSLFEKAALNNGLITYACTGSLDGVMGDMILLAPPLSITKEQIDDLLSIIDYSIKEVEILVMD